jgi:hypothetical protein
MSTHSRSGWKLPSRGALARPRRAASYFSTRLCVDTLVKTRRLRPTTTYTNNKSTCVSAHWRHRLLRREKDVTAK